MSQTINHCEPLVAVWLRPSTTEPCICCKQVAEKPRGEHLKMYVTIILTAISNMFAKNYQNLNKNIQFENIILTN